MADNILVKDSTGANKTMRTTDSSGVHTPHHILSIEGTPLGAAKPMPISDNGGSITVDGSVSISSITPGTGSTNLGSAVDSAAGATDTGVASLAVRDDVLATLTPIDGDYTHLRVNSQGRLWVSAVVDSALPAGANNIGSVTLAAGSNAVGSVTLGAGTNGIGKLTANSGVDIGDVDVISVTPGTAAANLGKLVNGVAGASDVGVAMLGIRDDTLSTLSPADGDYGRFRMDSIGRMWTNSHINNAYDAQEDMFKVKSVQKKFRDSFSNGSVVDAAKWPTQNVGSGMTLTQANNMMTIATGTTADAETVILGSEVFNIPFRLMAGFSMSQRIGRQTVYIEMVSVDPGTLQPDERFVAGWRYSGTTTTYGCYEVKSGVTSPRLISAMQTINTTSSVNVAEIEPFADECWFHSRITDSVSGRSQSFVRHQQIPDSNNQLYKLRIRVLNKGILSVTGAVSGTGSVVRLTATSHGLSTGDKVNVYNVNGVAAANGTNFTVTVVDTNTIELRGTVFAGTFVNDGYAYLETTTIAPASNTNVSFQFVNVVDYAELTAEITAGRGSTSAGQGISVIGAGGWMAMTAAPNSGVYINPIAGLFANLSSTALTAGSTYTGSVLSTSASYSDQARGYILVSVLHHAGTTGAHGTLFIETYDTTSTTTPSSGQRLTYSVPVPSDNLVHTFMFPIPTKYYRVLFKNNASVTQTAFNLSVSYRNAGAGNMDVESNIPFLLSTAALGSSATFTGTAFDLGVTSRYKTITLVSQADQSGTLALEQSYDGTTWLRTHSFAVAANEVAFKPALPLAMRYSRVVYVNDAVAQTSFKLHATIN